MNGAVAALRFFFTTTCNRPQMARHLGLLKQPQKLPVVLTTDEVLRLLEAAPGPKYKAALGVAYGAGLRVSEVANLKVSDINSERMVLRVEQSPPRRRPGAKARRTATACCRRGSWSCCGSGGAWASRRPGCSRGATRCCRSRHASSIGWFAIRRMRWGSRSVCRRIRCGTRSPPTAEMAELDIAGDAFHPEWNYTIKPRRRRTMWRLSLSKPLGKVASADQRYRLSHRPWRRRHL